MIRLGSPGETYNIGGNQECANLDLVRALCARIDAKFSRDDALAARFPGAPAAKGRPSEELVTFVKDRPGHDWRYAIDSGKAKSALSYEPVIDLDAGLDMTLEWILDNEAWWQGVMDGSYRDWVDKQYG